MVLAGVLLLATLVTGPVCAHGTPTDRALLDQVSYDQRIGESLPADTWFVDTSGHRRAIADLAAKRPLALIMVWLDCPNLCPILLGATAHAAAALPFAADEYRVAIVSINPDDGPDDARSKRAALRTSSGDALDNWTFLTGDKTNIDRLAAAIGFHYAYDPDSGRYAHPAGLVVVAPGGRINRYLFGLHPDPKTLKLALTEAGEGQVGSVATQILLRCFRFNPQTGQYTLSIVKLMRWGGSGFAVVLAVGVIWLRRKERR